MNTKKLTLTLSVVAAAGVLAAGGAVAFAANPDSGEPAHAAAQVTDSGDGKIAEQCLAAAEDVPAGTWRTGARIDIDATQGFLVIRTDKQAAVCVIQDGRGAGIMGDDFGSNHGYDELTAARPFDYLTSMNYETESVHFGVASDDVAGVSLVGPDNSVTGATLTDGTFIVTAKAAEDSNQPTTNHVRATLDNGQVIDAPFRR